MVLAWAAGIRVFATGGLGGVHRDAERSFDISADLAVLARVPMAVVCSGAKVILDLPRTLEALETLGVPVIGYGTDRFPAFVVRDSGLILEHRVDDPAAAADLLRAAWGLDLPGAVVIANPPPEGVAVPPDVVEAALEGALADAERSGVTGKALTPFLLDRLAAATGGASLAANTALIEANARLAARIAAALAQPAPAGR
jgi:pseudouridine-5'-phosphate glycosidase